jgi:ribosomal protein L20
LAKTSRRKVIALAKTQSAGQSNFIRVANKSFEKVAKFKYLGST